MKIDYGLLSSVRQKLLTLTEFEGISITFFESNAKILPRVLIEFDKILDKFPSHEALHLKYVQFSLRFESTPANHLQHKRLALSSLNALEGCTLSLEQGRKGKLRHLKQDFFPLKNGIVTLIQTFDSFLI